MNMSEKSKYNYIYGPVSSWRLGRSLGVDIVSGKKGKICNFDCVYCQAGKTAHFLKTRKIFIPTKNIIEEIKKIPPVKIDYITFSGAGEPTLAKNLGTIINAIRKLRKEKIAVITNSSLICREDVQRDLSAADLVIAKLDAASQKTFKRINKPLSGLKLEKTIKGLKEFKNGYKRKLALQIMFVEENKEEAGKIAGIAREINPDEVQINTPLRPCGTKHLSRADIENITKYFKGLKTISVYAAKREKTNPISKKDTLRRRGAAR